MHSDPEPKPESPPQPEQDITPAERDALFTATLQSLNEAFLATADEDDQDTITELHQNAADAASDQIEDTP